MDEVAMLLNDEPQSDEQMNRIALVRMEAHLDQFATSVERLGTLAEQLKAEAEALRNFAQTLYDAVSALPRAHNDPSAPNTRE
jgi:hypothetical protein